MKRETWKRVEELFEAALAEPPAGREEFLEIACPDDSDVRTEVLSLLRSDDAAHSFLEDSPLAGKRPQLKRGHKLGHFDIIEVIGRGGMGEVYRARDTRLKREVAIKVLPVELARDPADILRFEREARAASALNHPNIVGVYEIGRKGQQYWIVSELVHGQSLREVLKRGALPVRRAVEIAVQIADGLAGAHVAGIVHRDLSPGNVMISAEGRIKILDFGLAKRSHAVSDMGGSVTEELTSPGLIIGTPGYMAPEQIAGKTADHRSDIFALGVILQEMLSGKPAFDGASTLEVLNANLKDDPLELPLSVPLALRGLVRRCLEKEPANRFQSAADVGFALIALSAVGVSTAPAMEPKHRSGQKSMTLVLGAVMLVLAGAYWMKRGATPQSGGNPVLTRLTTDAGLTTDGTISSDGKLVAFASDRANPENLDVWVKQIDFGSPPVRLTTDPADDYDPTFSPDGTRIAFRSERDGGGIYEIPTLGGEARLIIPHGRRPRFSPDGRFLLYWTGLASRGNPTGIVTSLYVQPVSGDRPTQIGADCSYVQAPAVWSPDSRHVLFQGLCKEQLSVWMFNLDGTPLQPRNALYRHLSDNAFRFYPPVTEDPIFIFHEWLAPPSRLSMSMFAGDSVDIAAVPVSADASRVVGETQKLTFGTGVEYRVASASTGRMVLSSVDSNLHVWGVPISEDGKATRKSIQLTSELSKVLSLSKDGNMMATGSNLEEAFEIHSIDLRTRKQTRTTAGSGDLEGFAMNWAGTRLVYGVNQNEKSTVWEVASFGGLPHKLTDQPFSVTDWSPDSRFLLGVVDIPWRHSTRSGPLPKPKITILDIETRELTKFLADLSGRQLWQAHFSNDGHWATFNAVSANHSQVYVAPFRKALVPESEWISVTDGRGWDDKPHFSYNDKLLFFTSHRDGFRCIWAQPLSSGMQPVGKPWPVYHSHLSRRSIGNTSIGTLELGIGPNMIVFNEQEFVGNLWLLDSPKK